MRFKNPECPEEQHQRLEAWMRQLESLPAAGRWTKPYEVHLLTPIFGGGVVSGQPEPVLPIRTREVLYQLRFWWRILKVADLRRRGVPDQPCQLRKEETELFGWRGKRRSRVHAVIKMLADPEKKSMYKWRESIPKLIKNTWSLKYASPLSEPNKRSFKNEMQNARSLEYAFWDSLVEGKECLCFNPDSPAFQLRLGLDLVTGQHEQKRELEEALRWWASFGGLGARTRRGMGAVWVQNSSGMVLPPVTEEEAANFGCILKISPWKNGAVTALGYGIRRLYEFRQGRKARKITFELNQEGHKVPKPHRSFWPEPDAIRRLAGHWDTEHDPNDLNGLNRPISPDLYPRAAFGLPIQFQFKGGVDEVNELDEGTIRDFRRIREENGDSFYLQGWEPTTTQLVPKNGDRLGDRLASPLILRPRIEADGRYRCVALRLPEPIAGLEGLTLGLKETKPSHRDYPLYRAQDVAYWDPTQAHLVLPIKNTKKTDPLDAFLAFFAP